MKEHEQSGFDIEHLCVDSWVLIFINMVANKINYLLFFKPTNTTPWTFYIDKIHLFLFYFKFPS